jgi:hypothetical protein
MNGITDLPIRNKPQTHQNTGWATSGQGSYNIA